MPLYFQENNPSGRKLSSGNPFRNSMAEKELADSEKKQKQTVETTSQEIPLNVIVGVVWWSPQVRESRETGNQGKRLRL